MNSKDVLYTLGQHVGAANGIGAEDLVMKITETVEPNPAGERKLREIISTLRRDGIPICGHPSTGYFIAATAEELNTTCSFLRSRALASLKQEAELRKISLPELLGQLKLQIALTDEDLNDGKDIKDNKGE